MLHKAIQNRWCRLALAVAATLLYAIGVNWFIVPMGLYTGGLLGFCQVARTLIVEALGLSPNVDFSGVLYLAANRVECRKHDSFRGVIHYDFNTCCCFQSTDVTSFTTDDATFDFIGFDMEYGDRVFDSCFCSNSLNGLDNDSFGFLVGCQLGIVHDIINVRSSLCFGFLLQRVHQTFFGFFGRQTG